MDDDVAEVAAAGRRGQLYMGRAAHEGDQFQETLADQIRMPTRWPCGTDDSEFTERPDELPGVDRPAAVPGLENKASSGQDRDSGEDAFGGDASHSDRVIR